ncbi:hypothetical protein D3C80_1640670 [compost metagenome]
MGFSSGIYERVKELFFGCNQTKSNGFEKPLGLWQSGLEYSIKERGGYCNRFSIANSFRFKKHCKNEWL